MESRHPRSQPDQPQPSTASLSRRYACDRCRSHKLRCNRDLMISTNSPCQRCRKARVKCTIGSSIQLGLAHERRSKDGLEDDVQRSSAGGTNAPQPHQTTQNGPSQPSRRITAESQHHQPYANNRALSDTLHLSPVPWLDTTDPSFDGSQGLNFDGPSSANSHAEEILRTHRLPITTCPPLPSATHSFEPSPPPHMPATGHQGSWLNDKEQMDMLALNQVAETRPAVDPPVACHGNPTAAASREQGFGPWTSMISEPVGADEIPLPPRTANWSQLGHSPTELKQACIQRLADLSASLVKDLDHIVTCKTASSFLFTPSDKAAAGYLFKTLDGSMSDNNAVGRMLHGSEQFLDIVKVLNQPPFTPSTSSSSTGESSYAPLGQPLEHDDVYDYSDLEDAADVRCGNQSLEDRKAERWTLLQSYLGRSNRPSAITSSGSTESTHSSSLFVEQHKLDVPSTLVILSCYTCLLKIYETVFLVIHHVLECAPTTASTLELPQTVRDLKIDGFLLQNHRRLQIKILIQVSTYMLDSIQRALGGILADSMFQALLKTLLKEEGFSSSSETEETGMENIRDVLRRIEDILQ